MALEITDAAAELAALGTYLRESGTRLAINNLSTHDALMRALEATDSLEFLELAGAISGRLKALALFTSQVEDPHLDDDLRSEVKKSVANFASIFVPPTANESWQSVNTSKLGAEALRPLKWVSPIIHRHQPIKVLGDEERQQLLTKLDGLLADLPSDESLPVWTREALIDGLQRLELVVRKIRFFGHRVVLGRVIELEKIVSVVSAREEASPHGNSLMGVLNVIALVWTLFVLPDQTAPAIQHYREWWSALSHQSQQGQIPTSSRLFLPAPEQRLRGPTTSLTDDTGRAND
jgi:hypothetical protein